MKKDKKWIFWGLLLIPALCSIFLFYDLQYAEVAGTRLKGNIGDTCFNCHPDISKEISAGLVHKPVKLKECISCHSPHASKNKNLIAPGGDHICIKCHNDQDIGINNAVKHEPFEFFECQKCHKPHVSEHKRLLVRDKKDICYICHDANSFQKANIHDPVKRGGCEICHLPHSSDNPSLLRDSSPAVCLGCHKNLKVHSGIIIKTVDCTLCHNPHSSEREHLIYTFDHQPYKEKRCTECHEKVSGIIRRVSGNSALCFKCHKELKAEIEGMNKSHIVKGERECTFCHNPHGSDRKDLVRGKDGRLCMSCHTEVIKRLKFESDVDRHPEVKARRCFICHDSHSANNENFIKEDIITICQSCHTRQKVFCHPIGEKALDPRTKKPILCITCHNPMNAKHPQLMRLDGQEILCKQCHKNY